MGTTLTGTTPQDTYDALIKVTDNGPLSGTAKYLSDGLGNDSALALSTSRVGVGTSSPAYTLDTRGISATFNAGLDGTTQPTLYLGHPSYTTTYLNKISTSVSAAAVSQLMQFSVGNGASTYADVMTLNGLGNVGIGTNEPAAKLDILGAGNQAISGKGQLFIADGGTAAQAAGEGGQLSFGAWLNGDLSAPYPMATLKGISEVATTNQNQGALIIGTSDTNAAVVERVRITSENYLRLAAGGIQFNGDTAAANALDDYEEGTWTMTAGPQASGTITLGTNGGTYTKIGRQVTCTGRAIVSSVSSPVGGYVQFGGLPFTPLNLVAAQSSPSIYFADASAGYASSSIPSYLPNNLTVFYAFKDASTIAASDEFAFTITYFV